MNSVDYFVFGGCLRSEVKFPDLSMATSCDVPDWEVRVATTGIPQVSADFLGKYEIWPGWTFRLYSLANGFRLEYGTTGTYDILSAGSQIVWYPGSNAPLETVRAILLGPVMALALHQCGILCLHGSAVTIEGNGIAILARKHSGKSTLALALTAVGSRLVTDDLVAVIPSSSPIMKPGVHSIRMRDDIAERLGRKIPGTIVHHGWRKTLGNFAEYHVQWTPSPLIAIYLLQPLSELPEGLAVSRTRLPLTQAAASLAHQTKLADELVGYRSAGAMLQWIARIVSTIPVYRLDVIRDLERLPEVVQELMAWHGPVTVPGKVTAPLE
jgi:hypothetical protein